MKQKRTKIKIKRSKINLYAKRKSNKRKQVLTVIITIASALALGVLGFGLGKPLMDYFQNRDKGESSSSAWTPPSEEAPASSEESALSSEESSAPPPKVEIPTDMYILPEDAALSSASLQSALAAAKPSGKSVVAVTVKDEIGCFYYKTNIKKALEWNETHDDKIILGALTAAQICDAVEKAGFIPAARYSTLKDKSCNVASGAFEMSTGGTWHDNREDRGGKPWLSPFSSIALQYVGDIAAELSSAGFKRVIAFNISLPHFFNEDISQNLSQLPLSDEKARLLALWDAVNAARAGAQRNDAEFSLEIAGENIIALNRLSTDAELFSDSEMLRGIKIVVDYIPTAAAADAYAAAKAFAERLHAAMTDFEYYVAIKGGYTGAALADVQKALGEAGITVFAQ